jgi:Tol biopolymer transport system component
MLRALPFALCALLLSACQMAQPAATFIREHTECIPEYYSTPVWSPDGAEIYFTVRSGASSSIRAMRPSGSGQRRLIPDAAYPYPSPDGRWVVYVYISANARGGPPDYNIMDLTNGRVWALNALGGPFSWSRDGTQIAYSTPAVLKVSMLDVESGLITPLAPDQPEEDAYAPLWSPDGARIAFAYNQDGPVAVYTMNPQGGDIRRLTGGGGACAGGGTVREIPMAWLPDSSGLLYARSCGSSQVMHMVMRDGTEVTGRAYLNRSVVSASWSPDGKYVLLYEDNLGKEAILVANADGTNLHVLRTNSSDPHWSPDSQRIVFAGLDAGGWDQIYAIAPDGSDLTRLTDNPGAAKVCIH